MPLYEPTMPVRYVRPLLDLLRDSSRGERAQILHAGGISERRLGQRGSVTMAQFDAVVCAAVQALGRSDIGFQLGRVIGRDSHDALSEVLRNCATLDAMLRTITRYWRLISPAVVLRYVRRPSRGEYLLRPAADMSRTTLHALEEIFAVGFDRDCRALVGTTAGVEIWLSMPPPSHIDRYRRLAPTRFYFGANPLPEVRCHIPTPLLDRPLAHLQGGLPSTFQRLLKQHRDVPRSRHVGEWIALMLREAEGVQPTLADFAQLLDVSTRTLSRQLAAEGCDLRKASTAIRHERACRLLAYSKEPIGAIAGRLGYGSACAFSTAFRKREGRGPREYRQTAASQQSSSGMT